MISSRLRRVEEKNASKRIAIAFVGSIALLVFLAIFGLRILVGFSLLVDRIRGTTTPQQQSALLLPPILDPLPEAIKDATITVTGKASSKSTIILYVNGDEYKRLPTTDDGSFNVSDIPVSEGTVTASAKATDEKDNVSDVSNVISTTVDRTPPKLTVDAPADNTSINDGTHKVTVTGLTDEDMKVTVNDRIVVIKSDGSFTYSVPLNDGENKLTITSRDDAGNETTVERKVTYVP